MCILNNSTYIRLRILNHRNFLTEILYMTEIKASLIETYRLGKEKERERKEGRPEGWNEGRMEGGKKGESREVVERER